MDKNEFAKTPPMGWNSYDYYDTTVTEQDVKANADYMAANLKEYGWEYIVVDIQWYVNNAGSRREEYQYLPFSELRMDDYGRLQPSPNRFPSSADGSGFTHLAEYIHKLGLKFGIHIMRGIPRVAAHLNLPIYGSTASAMDVADPYSICGWNPDMYGVKNNEAGQWYYDSLIAMYADWGVDFIKCDDICDSWLYRDTPLAFSGWEETVMLHKAIEKCGRPIVLSLSPGPAHVDRAWHYSTCANMWRITDDFWDDWKYLKDMFTRCEQWQAHVSMGCYPDCDMLPLGMLGKGFGRERSCNFTEDEKKTMLTLWCMFRSPLMLGAELTKLDETTLALLTNRALLFLLGENRHGRQLARTEDYAVWMNVENDRENACIALFNLSEKPQQLCMPAAELLDLKDGQEAQLGELWEGELGSTREGKIEALVPPHGVRVYAVNKMQG